MDPAAARRALRSSVAAESALVCGLVRDRRPRRASPAIAVNLGFVVETERQVEEHLTGHIERLPAADATEPRDRRADARRRSAPRRAAQQAGAPPLPFPVRRADARRRRRDARGRVPDLNGPSSTRAARRAARRARLAIAAPAAPAAALRAVPRARRSRAIDAASTFLITASASRNSTRAMTTRISPDLTRTRRSPLRGAGRAQSYPRSVSGARSQASMQQRSSRSGRRSASAAISRSSSAAGAAVRPRATTPCQRAASRAASRQSSGTLSRADIRFGERERRRASIPRLGHARRGSLPLPRSCASTA